jgi:type IV pilus assembly protein PilV
MNTNRNSMGSIRHRNCSGLTLLEVLIAVLVLSIGMLGLAGLQTASLRFNTSAYYRTQATSLAYDLVDRLRANRDAALDGEYNAIAFEAPPPACDPGLVIDPADPIAMQDIAAWRNALACSLPLGTGAVVRPGPATDNEFTISVQWDEARGEADDAVFGVMTFSFTTRL